MPISTRVQTLWGRLRRLVPPPVSTSGTHYTRSRLAAALLGAVDLLNGVTPVPSMDQQALNAEDQLLFPSTLGRTDASPTDWTLANAIRWHFAPTVTPGAGDFFLDEWGNTLTIPREPGEPDVSYGSRVLREIIRPTTTNVGMAQAIDAGVGMVGTVVKEAASYFTIYRANEGYRANTGIHANNAFGLTDTPWCCFIILIPSTPPAPYTIDTITRIANRSKAAGTRLLGILLTEQVTVFAPATCSLTSVNSAYASGPVGSTWHWTITNGVILSGQGTNTITYQASGTGNVLLTAAATPPSGPVVYGNATTVAYSTPDTTITVPAYVWAGQFDITASAPLVPGATYIWSGANLDYDGANNLNTFVFDAGEAGLVNLQVIITTPGGTATGNFSVKAVPYTSDAQHVTVSIPAGSYEDFTFNLGWQFQINSMSSNYPCLLRVYARTSDRTADAMRPLTSDPSSSTAIIFEGQTAPGLLSFTLAHTPIGTNGDTPTRTQNAYCRVYNTDSVARVITVTLNRTELQVGPTF